MSQTDHHPPPAGPLPDLAPLGLILRWHPDGASFDVGYLITNQGDAPAHGGFKITLYAHYRDHSEDPASDHYTQEDLTFPPNIEIEPGDIYPSGYLENIPFRPNKLDEHIYPKVRYDFVCTVDAASQVGESNEFNNTSVQMDLDIGLPRIIRPPVGPLHP